MTYCYIFEFGCPKKLLALVLKMFSCSNFTKTVVQLLFNCLEFDLFLLQHEAGQAAYGDAQEQIKDLKRRIEAKTSSLSKIQSDMEKKKIEASEAHEVEQVFCFRY